VVEVVTGRGVANLDWLLSGTSSDFVMPPSTLFEADDDNWRCSVERVALAPNLQVYLNNVEARRDFRVEPMSLGMPVLVGQVPLEGRLDLRFGDGEMVSATPQSAVLYRPVAPAVHGFHADIRYCSVGYALSVQRAERLLDGSVPSVLRSLLDDARPSGGHITTRMRRALRASALGMFDRSLTGVLRNIMLEGLALQLFALQVAASSSVRPDETLSRRERSLVDEALDRLLADMRRPPSLGELAEATGMSEKRLNACFRKAFGTTIFETLRNHRLNHARQALEAGSLSLKEIAWRVGYSNVPNFVNAFRARYGKPPRQFIERKRS
jgi:AraC-like DNA-binding protein